MPDALQLKICGLTQPEQAAAVAAMGVEAIGVIGVAGSPRCLDSEQRDRVFDAVASVAPDCERVLVLADPSDAELESVASAGRTRATVLQLHGGETPERCAAISRLLPDLTLWKAWRLRAPEEIELLLTYRHNVQALLLDAWHPQQLGGTGTRLPLDWLADAGSLGRWWLAGGVCEEALPQMLSRVRPSGLDASSRLERSPGIKDLDRVRRLVDAVQAFDRPPGAGSG
ncbi:phosphoribosylanthranilate isomerase [Synechococcus sp. RSCCF101]|uniref:phosphoribosylanthranilate isomerase n=1 Tax=Synechococcus sp. RSCCF101 TaxID=2511069 RepID=UPI0012473967|nr:phosphoribosylanthranilate isomerase [Synechococcus sp. RSCCF101]QEY31355.1 phosphoribosylanthranilate isomerase [Synechococcus sp. RSCCF101]